MTRPGITARLNLTSAQLQAAKNEQLLLRAERDDLLRRLEDNRARIRDARHARDRAAADARKAGETWEQIAHHARLATLLAARKAAERGNGGDMPQPEGIIGG